METRSMTLLWRFLCLLNLIAILFLSGACTLTALRVCQSGQARLFLDRLDALPAAPWMMPVGALIGYGLLFLVSSYRRKRQRYALFCCTAEIGLCIWIVFVMQMNFKGVVLLVLADMLVYLDTWRKRGYMLAVMTALYVAADANLLSIVRPILSFEEYVGFYTRRQAGLLLGMRNLLTSASVILFVLFSVLLMRQQSAETRRIRRLNEALAAANVQLEQLAETRERMAETRERNRLAREIHDTLGHSLTGISAGVDACLALLRVSPEAAEAQLRLVAQAARRGLDDVRASVSALHPDEAPRVELSNALTQLAADAAATSGAQIEIRTALAGVRLNPDEDHAILRLVQEGITNALRHGHADRITVTMGPDESGVWLNLCVKDNGRGCADVAPHFGLRHMKERFDLLGGRVRFDGSDGFTIEAQLPLRREEIL